LTINLDYHSPGETVTFFGTAGSAPANAVGGGNLQQLVASAARYWESAILDDHTLELGFGWFPRDPGRATHLAIDVVGRPLRETVASIGFDNDQSTEWFLDPTPGNHSEFTQLTTYTDDFGGGTMTTGIEYTGGTGAAAATDLLTLAIHAMGHALGLSSDNRAFTLEVVDDDIDVLSPRPFASAQLPTVGAHLNLPHALIGPAFDISGGMRRLLSEADILANAQVSQYEQINLHPVLVPEPVSIVLVALGLVGFAAGTRRLPR
jgi:hypothetical protein